MALCIRVCAKRRTRGARAGKPRPPPDARPDWPPAAAGRPAREHTRAGGAGPVGPPEGRPTPDPNALPPGPGARSHYPLHLFLLPSPPLPRPHPAPQCRAALGQEEWPRERAPSGNWLNLANRSVKFRRGFSDGDSVRGAELKVSRWNVCGLTLPPLSERSYNMHLSPGESSLTLLGVLLLILTPQFSLLD